jgi:hypothetical protein
MPIFAHIFMEMTSRKQLAFTLVVFILVAALYRVLPGRPYGFAPHLAMALFAGAMIKDKRWAFAFPIASMFISDVLYQILYINGLSVMRGFYSGQLTNYLLFAGLTVFGFFLRKVNALNVMVHSITISVAYFLVSNFLVWNGGGGYARPHTFDGLIMCYVDALPFFQWNLISTVVFSIVLFGGWALFTRRKPQALTQAN